MPRHAISLSVCLYSSSLLSKAESPEKSDLSMLPVDPSVYPPEPC